MAKTPRATTGSYAVEAVGKLSRREAETFVLEIKWLARRHNLKVAGVTVRRRAREEPRA